jgi:hypothetical protein
MRFFAMKSGISYEQEQKMGALNASGTYVLVAIALSTLFDKNFTIYLKTSALLTVCP